MATLLGRGTAGFLGVFFLLNTVCHQRHPSMNPNLWLLDLRWLPGAGAVVGEGILGVALLAVAFNAAGGPWSRRLTRGVIALGVAVALANSAVYWHLLVTGKVRTGVLVPASMIWATALGMAFRTSGSIRTDLPCPGEQPSFPIAGRFEWLAVPAMAAAWVVAFPIIQCLCFGQTDYRRRADVAVVFGARVYANGQLSPAVADRIDTAVRLYQQGLIPRLVLSGGPGDGAIHETDAMLTRATAQGVPRSVITLDRAGLNTAATVRNTAANLRGKRVLAVSEFYHLPRIKLAYAASAIEVWTVPADASHWLRRWAVRSVLREVPAFWAYYARAFQAPAHN